MNRTIFLLFTALLIISCTHPHTPIPGVPEIDVTIRFPEREINLADIATITYVHLCTNNNDFLFGGSIDFVTENRIIVTCHVTDYVLFFSIDGTPISRFNPVSQGPGGLPYGRIRMAYDEVTDEVFVFSMFLQGGVIQVYSSAGIHKRTLSLPLGTSIMQLDIFDDQLLILFDMVNPFRTSALHDTSYSNFFLICRTDGQIVYHVPIPGSNFPIVTPMIASIVRHADGFLLCDIATDTVFFFCRNKTLTPVLWKTPPVSSMNPRLALTNTIDSRYFQFFEIINLDNWRPRRYVRDKQTGRIYRQNLTLPEFQGRRFTISPNLHNFSSIQSYIQLCLQGLKQAYRQNRLSGELRELVSTLNEWEDNDVIALIQFK